MSTTTERTTSPVCSGEPPQPSVVDLPGDLKPTMQLVEEHKTWLTYEMMRHFRRTGQLRAWRINRRYFHSERDLLALLEPVPGPNGPEPVADDVDGW